MTKRFPMTTLKCETMVLSVHRKGVINGTKIGYGNGPRGNPQGNFNSINVEFSPFGKKQDDKEPVTICTIYYNCAQNMTAGCYTELWLQDEVSKCCFPSMMLFSRIAHMLKFETPWVKNPSAGCTRCCLCSSPSTER